METSLAVVIPSFAVGRTQELIYQLNMFYEENEDYRDRLEDLTVYVDSPMATNATEIFRRNAQVFDEETKEYILKGDNPLDFKNLKFTRTSDESRMLNFDPSPKVIISASGMCEAGRIKHHLKHNLWDPKNSVVFVGYQAEGTLGRSIVNGDKDVSIFGEKIHINAEIYNLEGFSGHADREGLLEWISSFTKAPKEIFLVHGEEKSKKDFADSIKKALGREAIVIEDFSEFDLETDSMIDKQDYRERIATEEEVMRIKTRLARVHDDLETILYNTNLAVDDSMKKEKFDNIRNMIIELEKNTMNLGSSVTLDK